MARLKRSGGATPSASQAGSSRTSLLSPPSSSMAVKHGLCLLTLKKRIQVCETTRLRKRLCISSLSTRRTTGCRARSTSLWVHGTSSGNCQGMETCMVRACHMPRQPLQNHPSGHLGVGDADVGRGNAGWTTTKSGHPCSFQNCSQWTTSKSGHPCSFHNCSQWPHAKKKKKKRLEENLC